MDTYHLAIVGGGSAAFAAALRASELGRRVAIVNEGLPIGGTCVNVGCVPSKTLIRAGEARHRASRPPFHGISVDRVESDFGAITGQVQELVGSLRQAKYLDVVQSDPNIRLVKARGRLVDAHTIDAGGQRITAENILIATGARTSAPPIPGLDKIDYLTNETAYTLEERPEHLLVLGGGYIALENAQAFARLGSRVTILELLPRILATEEPDVTDELTSHLQNEGIEIHTAVESTSVRRKGDEIVIEANHAGAERTFRGTRLFVATGRRGNTEDLGFETLGIETNASGYVQVDRTLRTAVSNVFAAGDVIGTQQFVYTAAYEGHLSADNALNGANRERGYEPLPWVVFTDPQVAGVGLDERQAREKGIEVEAATLPLDNIPRSLAARDTRGFIRLIRDRRSDRLVGARIVAPEGSELLMELTLAIKYNVTISDLVDTFHPYLTLSEGIKLAAITFGKDVKTLSCCAV